MFWWLTKEFYSLTPMPSEYQQQTAAPAKPTITKRLHRSNKSPQFDTQFTLFFAVRWATIFIQISNIILVVIWRADSKLNFLFVCSITTKASDEWQQYHANSLGNFFFSPQFKPINSSPISSSPKSKGISITIECNGKTKIEWTMNDWHYKLKRLVFGQTFLLISIKSSKNQRRRNDRRW